VEFVDILRTCEYMSQKMHKTGAWMVERYVGTGEILGPWPLNRAAVRFLAVFFLLVIRGLFDKCMSGVRGVQRGVNSL